MAYGKAASVILFVFFTWVCAGCQEASEQREPNYDSRNQNTPLTLLTDPFYSRQGVDDYLKTLDAESNEEKQYQACDHLYAVSGCDFDCSNGTCPRGDLQGDMNFWFGNFHSHTQYSDGSGTPAQAFVWAKETAEYDFYIVSDHAEQVSLCEWSDISLQANTYNQDSAFTALRGFEWSSVYGHINVINTIDYTDANTSMTLDTLYDWVDRHNALAQFNHPGREIDLFNDLELNPNLRDNFFAIETGNKNTGNNDDAYLIYYPYALDKGWRVAPTNNQDNHGLFTTSHRSVIICESLTRQDVLDAMKARRVYSSDDPNMEVIFKQGESWMGSELPLYGQQVSFDIRIIDDEPIIAVELKGNGGYTIDMLTPPPGTTSLLWQPTVTATEGYYYVQVTEEDHNDSDGPEQIVVTAPIWVY